MNDFSKGELEYLDYAVSVDIDIQDYLNGSSAHVVRDKLRTLIRDYCDHSGFIGIHEWKTCNDCGEPFA